MNSGYKEIEAAEEATQLAQETRGILDAAAQAQGAGRHAADLTPRERAMALHDFVRDEVLFGWTELFDEAPPRYTLSSEVFQLYRLVFHWKSCRGLVVMSCDSYSRGRGF